MKQAGQPRRNGLAGRLENAQNGSMRVLNIHAHFDDFEFTASGTFELLRRRYGKDFSAKVLVCTDGAAGHHERSRQETATLRLKEQEESARRGNYAFECLRLGNGRVPREACLEPGRELLAALWRAIREFEPDYVFCPPVPQDPLAGIHVDHVVVAEAVRRVAYLINVPHCFTPEFPGRKRLAKACKTPVILNVWDGYLAGRASYHLAIDVKPVFEKICELTYCHRSQICEWLPWVGRHEMVAPRDFAEWEAMMRQRIQDRNRSLGVSRRGAIEVFSVTRWGIIPTRRQLKEDLPGLLTGLTRFPDWLSR